MDDETDGGKLEECFEMVEYFTDAQREELCFEAISTLTRWLKIKSSEVEEFARIRIFDSSFKLSYLKSQAPGGEPLVFTSHRIRYPDVPLHPSRPLLQLLYRTGFSSLLLLESEPHPTLNLDGHECPRRQLKPEITSMLIEVGRSILQKSGVRHLPILVPAHTQSARQFKGIVSLPVEAVEGSLPTGELYHRIAMSDLPASEFIALRSFKELRDCCAELTKRQFGALCDLAFQARLEFAAGATFDPKPAVSAHYQYFVNFADEASWTEVKGSPTETRGGKSRPKRGLGFGGLELAGFLPANNTVDEPPRPYCPPQPAWGASLDPIQGFEVAATFACLDLNREAWVEAPTLYIGAAFNQPPPEGGVLAQILQNAVKYCCDEDYSCVFTFEPENHPRSNGEPSSRPYGTRNRQDVREELECREFIEHLFVATPPSQRGADPAGRLGASRLDSVSNSVPYQSLLWQLILGCVSAASRENRVELRSVLVPLWRCFTAKVRHSWENHLVIPNVNPACADGRLEVDLRFNLLHQKLSMINYCSERRQAASSSLHLSASSGVSSEARPVEFPTDSYGLAASPELLSPPASFPSARTDPGCRRPQRVVRENSLASESFVQLACPSSSDSYASFAGTPHASSVERARLGVLEGCRLLLHDEPIYVPVTQDPGLMTEDMLKEQAQLFEQLGTSAQATQRRAQLQGAHLLSDMESFKAANPRATLGDFVRWYSPRDWVTAPGHPQGKLSARMGNPDNLWQELWQRAEPVPAHRQKPLFNPDTEGEKALHYLEHLTVFELLRLLLPTVFLVACDVLVGALPLADLPLPRARLDSLASQLALHPWSDPDPSILLDRFNDAELFVARVHSCLKKLPGQFRLVSELLSQGRPVAVGGDAERAAVLALLGIDAIPPDPARTSPPAYRREFVFEGRNSPAGGHHRLHLELTDAGAKLSSLHPGSAASVCTDYKLFMASEAGGAISEPAVTRDIVSLPRAEAELVVRAGPRYLRIRLLALHIPHPVAKVAFDDNSTHGALPTLTQVLGKA
ncbi:hypothetical protein L0F63_003953 [Massospora cicadina]|nr:hypothetical protein L0F63_003953 [Massospora cicadina]